ncbi:DUF4856 domain-containing protein [Polaribacter litorisediminis]|uniref:DUF4856 domain-containing protein n=1 Tax=Polaribacter litorisediminis TaxID=1908341 RepID=UPI001CBE2ECB|nr:DUF4856 domain-containing protein [Polaribacter litorisediminis]UAM99217.1 DUF4856 domain-containing protein [Polaribacter litorisediminis]
MKKVILAFAIVASLMSCSSSDNPLIVEVPNTYSFSRNGSSTIAFPDQTTEIQMGDELAAALLNPLTTVSDLDGMFTNSGNKFSDATLNASSKSIRSKTAASKDFFEMNSSDAIQIKADFDTWITAQAEEVFPNWNNNAAQGVAGQLQEAGGGPIRWVNAKGLEYDQAIVKGLIGALMVDQILNNYLSTSVLDAGNNINDNTNDVLVPGENYTNMEHAWDSAFGYVYGNEQDITAPVLNVDQYLNKYVNRLKGDPDFAMIPDEIYEAFKLGRAAIVNKDYMARDAQIQILREKISEIIGIRAVYYLQVAKATLANDKGSAFHDLAEGFGFIYSLQFTRKPNSTEPYFTKSEVDGFINTLMQGDGFWDITTTTLDEMSETIAAKFNFTVAQAGS